MNRWCPENNDLKRKREDDEDVFTTYKHQSHLNAYGFYEQTIIQIRTRWTLINTQSTHTN
jgi:hypothetical protein